MEKVSLIIGCLCGVFSAVMLCACAIAAVRIVRQLYLEWVARGRQD